MNLAVDTGATYRLLENALKEIGYTVALSYEDEQLIVTYTSPGGASWRTRAAHIRYPFTSATAHSLSVDKAAAYEFVDHAGVPVPATHLIDIVDSLDGTAVTQLIAQHAPLVVKPNDSSLSQGLTLNVSTHQELTRAVQIARQVKRSDVLVQEQVTGEELRFVIIKGKVVAALLRQTPRVIGDGASTVQELIETENQVRRTLRFPYITYPELDDSLIDASFFTRTDVLKSGEVLELSRATMIKNGCSVFEILDTVHPSYIEDVERLAEPIGADFFVADFLIKDHTVPATPANHWFLEFNVSPVLKLCYGCRDGKMFDIVPLVAQLIDERLS
ncbi:MAG: hypothetical protein ACREGE_04110 [Candidatus Microsaccharimonas sp.]